MKRISLLLTTIFLCSFALVAQDDNITTTTSIDSTARKIKVRQELGLNGTYFLKQIISLSDTTLAVSPYLLTYKLMFNNLGLRVGIGGTYKREKETEEDFDDNVVRTTYTLDARLGVEYQKHFHKRWTAVAGLDFVYQKNAVKNSIDSGFDVITLEEGTEGIGAGPVFGLYFHFSKNLSLYTEGAFYYLLSERENSFTSVNIPQNTDRREKVEITELQTYLPATLYLIYRF